MIEQMIHIAKDAGEAILEVYGQKTFKKEIKADNSPVTEADLKAHHVIVDGLKKAFPHIPAFSEESNTVDYDQRKEWKEYFLIDPLDGTKEFIKRNGEFTVNIAYMKDNIPVLGVVYAPVMKLLYYNVDGQNAYKESDGKKEKLPMAQPGKKCFVMVASRSHMDEETKEYLEDLRCKHDEVELVNMGSSLKLCLVAEGVADAYPRSGPTSEWDTAAAHAIVKASGGEVYQHGARRPLEYNKADIINPGFEVSSVKIK